MSQLYLIWSVEHSGWWGPDECGYVRSVSQAGRYEALVADDICAKANIACAAGQVNEVAIPERAAKPESMATNVTVPEDFEGSPAQDLLKRAGRMIECAFHVFTFRRKSTGEWRNLIVFEDQDKQEFCYAFDLDEMASITLAHLLVKGLDTIKEMEQPGARA